MRSCLCWGVALHAVVLLGSGCVDTDPSESHDAAGSDGPSVGVAAVVDGQPIEDAEIDRSIRLELHDLDQASYRARRDRLIELVAARLDASITPGSPAWHERVEIRLAPPVPPRIDLPGRTHSLRGSEDARVTLAEFIDFTSPHARRLQPQLAALVERHAPHLRLVLYDLPLPYHRNARVAAEAVHCAAEQGAYRAYHDLLLLQDSVVGASTLLDLAQQLRLDGAAFESCLSASRSSGRIDADLALASRIGVHRAGTVFVNGLYLSGHPNRESIEAVVLAELVRLGIEPTAEAPGRRESDAARVDRERAAARAARRASLPEIPAGQVREPDSVIELSRAEVDRALSDRRSLARKLEASRAEFSGQRLLIVRNVTRNDFYARLGLEAEDVLLIVNDEFVTLEHDWIWDAFETEPVVRLVFMRRGLPHAVEYRIR